MEARVKLEAAARRAAGEQERGRIPGHCWVLDAHAVGRSPVAPSPTGDAQAKRQTSPADATRRAILVGTNNYVL